MTSILREVYRTPAGSTVEITGKHRGIVAITFDWFEENACMEAHPVENMSDKDEPMLTWSCECCGYGSARLVRVESSCA